MQAADSRGGAFGRCSSRQQPSPRPATQWCSSLPHAHCRKRCAARSFGRTRAPGRWNSSTTWRRLREGQVGKWAGKRRRHPAVSLSSLQSASGGGAKCRRGQAAQHTRIRTGPRGPPAHMFPNTCLNSHCAARGQAEERAVGRAACCASIATCPLGSAGGKCAASPRCPPPPSSSTHAPYACTCVPPPCRCSGSSTIRCTQCPRGASRRSSAPAPGSSAGGWGGWPAPGARAGCLAR